MGFNPRTSGLKEDGTGSPDFWVRREERGLAPDSCICGPELVTWVPEGGELGALWGLSEEGAGAWTPARMGWGRAAGPHDSRSDGEGTWEPGLLV